MHVPSSAPLAGRAAASERLLLPSPVRPRAAVWPSIVGGLVAVAIGLGVDVWWGVVVATVALVRLLLGRTLAPTSVVRFERALTGGLGWLAAHLLLGPVWLFGLVPLGLITRRRSAWRGGPPSWKPMRDGAAADHERWS